MTLKQAIIQELLDAVDDPAGLEEVFQRHRHSKGPFYLGLAEATSQVELRFNDVVGEVFEAETRKDAFWQELGSLAEQKQGFEEEIHNLGLQAQQARKEQVQARELLDQAVDLKKRGFGEEELSRLNEILAGMAASQGAPPEEGVAQFFNTVLRYEQVVSLDLEATRAESRAAQAKAEAELLEAQVAAREVQSKARLSVIDLVEDLLGKGIDSDDLPIWAAIIDKAGVNVEELAESLDEYCTIQALSADRQRQTEEIQTELKALEAQVRALFQERDDTHQAIVAVKEMALKQVKAAERQARQHVDSLLRDATNYSYLKKEAADLGQWIQAARILQAGAESWSQLPREVVQHLLMVALKWAEVEGHNPLMSLPDALRRSSRLPTSVRLSLSELPFWGLTGLVTEEEQKAILARP